MPKTWWETVDDVVNPKFAAIEDYLDSPANIGVPGLASADTTRAVGKTALGALRGATKAIAAPAAGLGALFSEANLEDNRARAAAERYGTPKPSGPGPDLGKAFKEGHEAGTQNFMENFGALDAASMAAGMPAGKAWKVADLALTGADMTLGAGQTYEGVRDKDWAKVAAGVARVAGNAAGGLKNVEELRHLGVKISDMPAKLEPRADDPLAMEDVDLKPRVLSDKSKQSPSLMAKDTSGENFTVEVNTQTGVVSHLAAERLRRAQADPHVATALAEQAQLLRMGDAAEADEMIAKFADEFGEDPGLTYARSGNFQGFLTEGNRRGMTYSGADRSGAGKGVTKQNAYWVNPFKIATDAQTQLDLALDPMKTPDLEAGKVLDMLDPETAKSMIELRETGARDPMLELKAKARMYMVKLLYAASHERTLHIPTDSAHPEVPLGGADYRTPIKSHSGQTLADVTHLPAPEGGSNFDNMHNWWLKQMADPKKGAQIKALVDSENFRARALEWYAAMNPADVPDELLPQVRVAKRNDRVVGRAEATRAVLEQDRIAKEALEKEPLGVLPEGVTIKRQPAMGDIVDPRRGMVRDPSVRGDGTPWPGSYNSPEDLRTGASQTVIKEIMRRQNEGMVRSDEPLPPTPHGDVPPGSSGGAPQGPQLPPLSKRIQMALLDQKKAGAIAEQQRGTIRKLQAEAIRDLEAKFQGHEIDLDTFEAEKARIMSGTMGLEQRVNGMAIMPEEKLAMIERIRAEGGDDAFLRNRLHDSFNKLVAGERLQDAEVKELRSFLHEKTADLKKTGFEKFTEFFSEATGGIRAFRTSYDLSAWRQGLYAIPLNPTAFGRAVKAQISSLLMSPAEFQTFMKRLQDVDTNPYAEISKAAGLHFSETMEKGAPLTREEAFTSGKWAQAIPGVRRSEQAYIAFLNKLRTEVFNKHVMQLVDSGVSLTDADGLVTQQVKDLAYMVNTLTGRGELSAAHVSPASPLGKKLKLEETFSPGKTKMDQMHTALTAGFFAPRFQASRFAMMRDASMALVGGNLDPVVYRAYMKNMFGTVAAITSAMYALQAAGAGTFERDPRKKDFGVIKAGKVRYDGYGSLKQWARLFAQMGEDRLYGHPRVRGERHQTGEKFKALTQFGHSKLSPLAALAVTAITGEDFLGRKAEAGQVARSLAMPMILETVYDVIQEGEADQLGAAIPAATFGVGVNAYSDQKQRKVR